MRRTFKCQKFHGKGRSGASREFQLIFFDCGRAFWVPVLLLTTVLCIPALDCIAECFVVHLFWMQSQHVVAMMKRGAPFT